MIKDSTYIRFSGARVFLVLLKPMIICVFLMSFYAVSAQYRVRTIEISKKINAIQNHPSGKLLYGTASGEIGVYDGLQTNQLWQLPGSINKIETIGDETYYMTTKGLYIIKNGRIELRSPNNISVLDRSTDGKYLVCESGIYVQAGNDYVSERENFYAINEIQKGEAFVNGGLQFLRIDDEIHVKKKDWDVAVFHPQKDFTCLTGEEESFIVGDKKGIVKFYNEGTSVDTLWQQDSIVISKLFQLNGSELLYCVNNQTGVFNVRKKEFRAVHSINTELITDANADLWGNIWIAAGSYLYQFINVKSDENNNPPEIEITAIKVNGSDTPIGQSINLKNDDNDLEISFSGVQLTKPQELFYQTRISFAKGNRYESSVPNINSWTKPSKNKQVDYRNLPAGKYNIEIRATIDNKYYTYVNPTILVKIEDDTFQFIYLMGLLAALGILISAIFFNNRYNRLKEKSDQERKILLQRNKVLTLQQKALQLQMNPHFVFNALNSIQGLIAKEDNKNARLYLQQFSSMMRSVLNQSREESIGIEEEIKYLKSYLSLEKMANNERFDYEIIEDESLEDDIKIPSMILQPFIENAIIHGVKGLEGRRGKITLKLGLEGNIIICTIRDNGIGREAAGKNRASSHRSVALEVVRERLTQKKYVPNPIVYRDLKDENGLAMGTEVELRMLVVR